VVAGAALWGLPPWSDHWLRFGLFVAISVIANSLRLRSVAVD